jgi:hypothetical protein
MLKQFEVDDKLKDHLLFCNLSMMVSHKRILSIVPGQRKVDDELKRQLWKHQHHFMLPDIKEQLSKKVAAFLKTCNKTESLEKPTGKSFYFRGKKVMALW